MHFLVFISREIFHSFQPSERNYLRKSLLLSGLQISFRKGVTPCPSIQTERLTLIKWVICGLCGQINWMGEDMKTDDPLDWTNQGVPSAEETESSNACG